MKTKAIQASMQVIEDVLAQRRAEGADEVLIELAEAAYAAGETLIEAMADFRRTMYAAGIEVVGGGALDEDDASRAMRIREMQTRATERFSLQAAREAERQEKAQQREDERAAKRAEKQAEKQAQAKAKAKQAPAKGVDKTKAGVRTPQATQATASGKKVSAAPLPLPRSQRRSAAETTAEPEFTDDDLLAAPETFKALSNARSYLAQSGRAPLTQADAVAASDDDEDEEDEEELAGQYAEDEDEEEEDFEDALDEDEDMDEDEDEEYVAEEDDDFETLTSASAHA